MSLLVVHVCISRESSGPGLFRSSVKCSAHFYSFSSADGNVFPSLSLIGLFVNWFHAESVFAYIVVF